MFVYRWRKQVDVKTFNAEHMFAPRPESNCLQSGHNHGTQLRPESNQRKVGTAPRKPSYGNNPRQQSVLCRRRLSSASNHRHRDQHILRSTDRGRLHVVYYTPIGLWSNLHVGYWLHVCMCVQVRESVCVWVYFNYSPPSGVHLIETWKLKSHQGWISQSACFDARGLAVNRSGYSIGTA